MGEFAAAPTHYGRRLALFQRADDRAAGVIGVFHGSFEVDVRNIFAPFDLFELSNIVARALQKKNIKTHNSTD